MQGLVCALQQHVWISGSASELSTTRSTLSQVRSEGAYKGERPARCIRSCPNVLSCTACVVSAHEEAGEVRSGTLNLNTGLHNLTLSFLGHLLICFGPFPRQEALPVLHASMVRVPAQFHLSSCALLCNSYTNKKHVAFDGMVS